MKYCMACGQQLVDVAKFCTKCGTKQPDNEAAPIEPTQPVTSATPQSIAEPTSQSATQPMTPATPVTTPQQPIATEMSAAPTAKSTAPSDTTTPAGNIQETLSQDRATDTTNKVLSAVTKVGLDVGPLMKTDVVLTKKAALGYADKTDNFVYAATPIDLLDLLSVKGLVGMKSQNYIMCFEADGILLIGTIGLAKFNDDNHFIKNEQVQSIRLERRLLQDWDHMFLTVDGEEIELLIQNHTFSMIPWHRKNAKKVLVYTD